MRGALREKDKQRVAGERIRSPKRHGRRDSETSYPRESYCIAHETIVRARITGAAILETIE